MKKFKFQFESVEKLRKIRQDEAMRELAQAQKKHQEAIEYRDQLLQDIENSWNRRQAFLSTAKSSNEFLIEDEYLKGLKVRVGQAEYAITRAKKFVDRAMIIYLQARKQSQIVDKLKENAQTEYRVAYNKDEQKQLDDLNTMRNRMKKGAA